jgi:hypothetical protein
VDEPYRMPVAPPFGPQVVQAGHFDSQGRWVEQSLWVAGLGSLPPGSRPRRRPPPRPDQEVNDARSR